MSHVEVQQNVKPDPVIKATGWFATVGSVAELGGARHKGDWQSVDCRASYGTCLTSPEKIDELTFAKKRGALEVRVVRCATALNRSPEMKRRVARNICN